MIARRLFDLAAPIIGLNVLTVLALAIDTAMVGHLDNAEALLTALGFATQVVFLLMVAMIGLTVGATAMVARAHGAGEHERVNRVLAQSTLLTVLLGLVVGAVGIVFAPQILRFMGAEQSALQGGVAFLRPLLAGTVFQYLSILYGGVMRGVGNTRLPFLVALLTTTLNVGINMVLIYGNLGFPALGVRGAALGTVIAQLVGAAILGLALHRGWVDGLRLSLRGCRMQPELARELFRVGAPAALDMLLINAGAIAILGMLGRIDQAAVAAHGIGLRIQSLAFVPGLGISQATGAMVGQALGAGNVDQARQVLRASIWLCTLLMTVLALPLVAAAHPIVAIFDVQAGSALETYSVQWIRVFGASMIAVGVHLAVVGLLQGSGTTSASLRINFYTLLLQVPLSALLGFGLDLEALGVWLAFPVAFVFRAFLAGHAYRQGAWIKVGVHA